MTSKLTDKLLLEQIYHLILNPDVTANERDILLTAKKNLEKGTYFLKIINQLKMDLAPLAIKQALSKPVFDLYSQLMRQFPQRDRWGLPGGLLF